MDIRMPQLDGLATTHRRAQRGSVSRIIMLTTFDPDELIVTALRNGAAGFLLKDTAPEDLVAAVRRAEPTLPPSVTAQLITAATTSQGDSRRGSAQALLDRLTERERQVALAVSEG